MTKRKNELHEDSNVLYENNGIQVEKKVQKTFPLQKTVSLTTDSMSFQHVDFSTNTEIPVSHLPILDRSSESAHVGSFGVKRKNHRHEGVDLYCHEGDPVYAMEDGIVVAVENFTGERANPPSPWWHDTEALLVESDEQVILYGEIKVLEGLEKGSVIQQGQLIGHIATVLKKDKGRPMNMLHLEMYEKGARVSVGWEPEQEEIPYQMKDPTELLIQAMNHKPE